MKHAIIILAHNEPEHLIKLVSYFEKDCYVLIHIDKKSSFEKKYIDQLDSMPQVTKVYRKYAVHWGGFSILQCELFMFREAVKIKDASYFHLLSGQDYPIRPLNYFLNFFERYNSIELLNCVRLPHQLWQRCTFSRFQYYYPYDCVSCGRDSSFVHKAVKIQMRTGFKRRIPDMIDYIYGGSQWMSVTRTAVKYLLLYTKKRPSLYYRMFMTFAPDETYIQTVLCNVISERYYERGNFRFIRWKYENGSNPAVLTKEHLHLLLENEYLFARKMSANKSSMLLSEINDRLLNDAQFSIGPTGAWIYDGYLRYKFNVKLFNSLMTYIKIEKLRDGVDIGCGTGLYVLNMRIQGFPIAGYDANPYVKELSKRIFPPSDVGCDYADITQEMDYSDCFDLVLCLDVLSYIPIDMLQVAVGNLSMLCKKTLIISLPRCKTDEMEMIILRVTSDYNVDYNKSVSNLFDFNIHDGLKYYIFEKR